MRVFPDMPMTAMPRGFSFEKGSRYAVIMAKTEYALEPGELGPGPTELEDAVKILLDADDPAGDPAAGLIRASEQAPTKPRADVLLFGSAHAPGGEPVAGVRTLLRVTRSNGEVVVDKEIDVVGDRVWKADGTRGDIEPFVSMPLTWARAFGGPGDKRNPAGAGRRSEALPNLEAPDRPVDSRDAGVPPICYAAVNPAWKPRCDKLGSYGPGYVEAHWPWLPGDFDWSHFNGAPDDQQVAGFLLGDETIELRHLVEGHAEFKTRLRGERCRAFVEVRERDGSMTFREVEMVMDTLTILPDEGKVSVCWRGQTEARSLKLLEFEHLMLVRERMDEPAKGIEHYRARMRRFVEKPYEAVLPEATLAEVNEGLALAEDGKKQAVEAKALAEGKRAEADAKIDEALARAAEKGFEVEDPRTKPKEAPPSRYDMVNDSIAGIERAIGMMEANDAAGLAERIAEARAKIAELESRRRELKAEYQRPTRDELESAASSGTPMRDRDLSYVDASGGLLAGLDVTGAFMLETVLVEADLSGVTLGGSILMQSSFARARLEGADLTGATLVESDFSGADLGGANLDAVSFVGSGVSGARLAGASMTMSVLMEAQLAGCDLSSCKGERAILMGADLTGAVLDHAELTSSVFMNATMENASLFFGDFRKSTFAGAKAAGACFVASDLRKASMLLGADLTGADLRLVNAPESTFQGATLDDAWFGGAELTRSIFAESKMRGTEMVCVNAPLTDLSDALIEDVDFTHSNLFRCTFDRAEIRRVHLEGASVFQSGFCESEIDTLWLADTNLKRTQLENPSR